MNKLIKQQIERNNLSGRKAKICRKMSLKVCRNTRVLAGLFAVIMLTTSICACTTQGDEAISIVPTDSAIESSAEQVYYPEHHLPSTMTASQRKAYNKLQTVTTQQLDTYTATWKDDGKQYHFVTNGEQEIVRVSRELSVAIECYFKSFGASDWLNPEQDKFWADNIEYLLTAIAYNESTYRTDSGNANHKGLTGLNKELLLTTFTNGNWFTSDIWDEGVPYINCNADEVDETNPVICLEYTLYGIGYLERNFFRTDGDFYDVKTNKRYSAWTYVSYDDENQIRLLIAGHRFGVGRLIDAMLGRVDEDTKRVMDINEFIYGSYVDAVMECYYELVDKYENQLVK